MRDRKKKSTVYFKECLVCKEKYFKLLANSWITWNKQKFCSFRCAGVIAKENNRGEKSGTWKGNLCEKPGLHDWARKEFGIPDHCDICGKYKQPKGAKRNHFEWSNRTGVYRREATHWWQLCMNCHRKYDSVMFNAYHKGEKLRDYAVLKNRVCK